MIYNFKIKKMEDKRHSHQKNNFKDQQVKHKQKLRKVHIEKILKKRRYSNTQQMEII